MKNSIPIHVDNRKQALSAGLKSGLIAGIIGASLFGFFLTLYFIWVENSILSFIIYPYILAYGIPIGMVSGAILGVIIGYVVYKSNKTVWQLTIYGAIFGVIAGIIFPVLLILAPIIFQTQPSTSYNQQVVISFIGGLLGGGTAGLIGSKLFLRFLNNQREI